MSADNAMTGPKAETWAQVVDAEMLSNGYRRLVLFLPNNGVKVVFAKGAIRGTSVGSAEDFSTLLVRAAVAAYEKEEG